MRAQGHQPEEGRLPPPGWLTPPPSPDTEPEGTGEAGSGRLQEHLLSLYESEVSFLGDGKNAGPPLGQRPPGLFRLTRSPECRPREETGHRRASKGARGAACCAPPRSVQGQVTRCRGDSTWSRRGAASPARPGQSKPPGRRGPVSQARRSQARGGDEGSLLQNRPPPPLLPVPTWRETEKIKLLPVVVKNQKNDDCQTLPKYCSSKQLLAAAGSPSCGRSQGGSRPEGYPLSFRYVRHRFLVPVNCAGFRNTDFASLCPIHSWPGTCTRVHKVLKQNNMLQPMPSDVKGTI